MDQSSMFDTSIDQDYDIKRTEPVEAPYAELEEGSIRLLRILLDPLEHGLSCEIVSTPLKGAPVYRALSYVWGSGADTSLIRLNGYPVYIRKNLRRFFDQARELGDSIFEWVWIDALCINQSNGRERTKQVNLMPEIYSRAAQVLIWLGPAYGASDLAMRELGRPISYWRVKRRALSIWTKPVGHAIRRLCFRTYWTRLWVLQEILLAQDIRVMCGAKIISWEPFRDFLTHMLDSTPPELTEGRFEHDAAVSSPAASMFWEASQQRRRTSLFDLMSTTQHLRCSELADKVYALLGVAEYNLTDISADYSTPLPTLLNLVLRSHHEQKPPKSLKEVDDHCRQLAGFLDMDVESAFSLADQHGCFQVPDPKEVEECPLGQFDGRLNLWWASFYGHRTVVGLLFEEGVVDRSYALISAVRMQNQAAVQLLLGTGEAELWVRDRFGRTPLVLASEKQNEAILRLLLATNKVDVNSRDDFGLTPMGWAMFNGNMPIVQLLVDAGKIDTRGFAKYGIDFNEDTWHMQLHSLFHGGLEMMTKLLLDTGALHLVPQLTGREDFTALHYAASYGHKRLVQLLIGTGQVSTAAIKPFGKTPLFMAVRERHKGIIQLLLRATQVECQIENNWKDRMAKISNEGELEKWHPGVLVEALKTGDEEIVKLLLDSRMVSTPGVREAQRLALESHYDSIADLLENHLFHMIEFDRRRLKKGCHCQICVELGEIVEDD